MSELLKAQCRQNCVKSMSLYFSSLFDMRSFLSRDLDVIKESFPSPVH